MLRRYRLKDYNFKLIFFLAAVSALGILLVGSAESSLQTRQLFGVVLGFTFMIIVSLIDYSWILRFYWIIYVLNLFLLIWVLFMGKTTNGASRWIQFGSDTTFTFQPIELCKILMILFFSMYLMKHEESLNKLKTFIKAIVLLLIPLILVIRQPDLKNTITITVVFCICIYVAGLSYKIIGGLILILIPLSFGVFFLITQTDLGIIDDYQKERIMTFLDPENEEYSDAVIQQTNSVTAIGSGQLTGKGLNNNEVSTSNKGNFVAEIQTDFIFAVAGEELGFVGCFGILLLLFLIVLECILTGMRAKDTAGKVLCCGVGALIAVQSFINICVATGLFPNTGTPLPFISYGLTSLVSLYIGAGFVLNVGLQNRKYYQEDLLHAKKQLRSW